MMCNPFYPPTYPSSSIYENEIFVLEENMLLATTDDEVLTNGGLARSRSFLTTDGFK